MAGDGTSSFEHTAANWEIYKDLFVPPPPRPRSKPWERAPVPAHAPRLHGQKIWKKAGLIPQQGNYNKENEDAAQAELERDGAGARKRARVIGAKQDVMDAMWQPWSEVVDGNLEVGGVFASPKKVSGRPDSLQVVPRKRTNANHLITPRKPARRAPLSDLGQPAEKTQLSSPKKLQLVVAGIAEQAFEMGISNGTVALETIARTGSPEVVRRRKSLRKSTRRLTCNDVLVGAKSDFATSPRSRPVYEDASTTLPECSTLNTPQVNSDSPSSSKSSLPQNPQLLIQEDRSMSPAVEDVELLPIVTGIPEEEQLASHSDDLPMVQSDIDTTAHATDISEPSHTREVTPVLPEPARRSSRFSCSPTKGLNTPKQKRSVSLQRQGTRRSTRTLRGSSVLLESQPTDQVEDLSILLEEIPDKDEGVTDEDEETETHLHFEREIEETREIISNEGEDIIGETRIETTESASTNESGDDALPEFAIEPDANIQDNGTTDDRDNLEACITHPSPTDVVDVSNRDQEVDHNETIQTAEQSTSSPNQSNQTSILPGDEDVETMSSDLSDISDKLTIMDDEQSQSIIPATHVDEPTIQVSPTYRSPSADNSVSEDNPDEDLEVLEVISITTTNDDTVDNFTLDVTTDFTTELTTELTTEVNSTPDPSTNALVNAISENAPTASYDHDDTDLLRDFVTRVKANKEAKAKAVLGPKRKRSYPPHSPIRIPLGEEPTLSPSPPARDEFDVSLPTSSPTKRRKRNEIADEDSTEPKSIRRSGRTRLPVKSIPGAPSFIPVRRLGQEGDSTITLRQSAEKDLVVLTRVNTRKNKAGALPPLEVLFKQTTENSDPASRQRSLKEKFDEKSLVKTSKKGKSVVWAEELAQYQILESVKAVGGKKKGSTSRKEKEKEKEVMGQVVVAAEEKKSTTTATTASVRVSRIALVRAGNGTPASKRKVNGRM